MSRRSDGEIPRSPKRRDAREACLAGIFQARGIQEVCLRCRRRCKVLKGTPGTADLFTCYDALEDSRA